MTQKQNKGKDNQYRLYYNAMVNVRLLNIEPQVNGLREFIDSEEILK
jgi:hypothetical protein